MERLRPLQPPLKRDRRHNPMIDLISIAIDLANGDYEPSKEPEMKAGPKQQQLRKLAKQRQKPPPKRSKISNISDLIHHIHLGTEKFSPKNRAAVELFREGTKQRLIIEMLSAPGGTTEEAILERLGWVKCRVTVKRVCDRAGKPLQKREENGETIWYV